MDESERIRVAAAQIADAIAKRDVGSLARFLAPGFRHRTPGGETRDADAFLAGIRDIPGEIKFVRLNRVEVDLSSTGALLTGVQHAQVRIDGSDIDDRRAFVDWFVLHDGEWRIRVAVDMPSPDELSRE